MPTAGAALLEDRYRLDERLAAGRFGDVWRATDVVLNRPVAVKLLHPGYREHPEILARFRFEAQHSGELSHENIVRVYDYAEPPAASAPFLVMELVSGPSLASVLRARPLSPAQVTEVIAQVAAGLAVAHRAGLVHRDIKPGNLLLDPEGLVKLTDFGIPDVADPARPASNGMATGGTNYTAPERVAGGRTGPASDLYSLGAVARECLAALPGNVPAGLAALVAELTARDPAARPASAAEVARRAARLRNRRAARLRDGRPARLRDRRPAGGGLSAAAGDRAGSGGGRPSVHGPPHRPAREPSSRRRVATGTAIALIALVATVAALLLSSTAGPVAASRPAAVPSSTAPRSVPRSAALVVDVNGRSLIGQPVSVAAARLRRHGLAVAVLWRASAEQSAGEVLSVQPAGRLAVGSHVTITGARPVPVSKHHPRKHKPSVKPSAVRLMARPHGSHLGCRSAITTDGTSHRRPARANPRTRHEPHRCGW